MINILIICWMATFGTEDKGEHSEFITKLLDMLKNYSEYISWNEDETEIIIKDAKEMTQKVLPKYFRHGKFESFIRQLNMYSFHKVCRQKKDTINFKNQHFFVGNQANFCKIRRKKKVDPKTHTSDAIQQNIKFIQQHPRLDEGMKILASLLLKAQFSTQYSTKKLSGLIQGIAKELRGVKLKKLEPYLSEIKSLVETVDKTSNQVQFLINTLKSAQQIPNTNPEIQAPPNKGVVNLTQYQSTINDLLEGTPIASTILGPMGGPKTIEVGNFMSAFKFCSFRSITSFIEMHPPKSKANSNVKEEDEDKRSTVSINLNEDKDDRDDQ